MKKKKALAAILALITFVSHVHSSDFQNIYGDAVAFFDFIQDPNTGLTVFPTLTIPMGGEYEGMATAYTAVARDSSFFDANPAASAMLEFTELSFLHNNWIADTSIEGVVYARRIENIGYAFAGKFLYVPFTGYDLWGDRTSGGYYAETIALANISRNFFADHYFAGISVGANLKTAYRHISESIAAGQSAVGVMADFGVLTRFNFLKFYYSRAKNASFGAVVKNVGPYALGEPLPMSAAAGFAYSPIRPLLLAADINYPFSFDSDKYPAEKPGYAVGASIAMTDFFSVQTGFLIKGGNPRISLGSMIDVDMLTLVVNYTLDMTTQFNNLDRVSIAVKLNLGDEGRRERARKVEDFYLVGIESYARGEIAASIDYFERALELDPSFTPARETIITARRAMELQTQMEDRQKIE